MSDLEWLFPLYTIVTVAVAAKLEKRCSEVLCGGREKSFCTYALLIGLAITALGVLPELFTPYSTWTRRCALVATLAVISVMITNGMCRLRK